MVTQLITFLASKFISRLGLWALACLFVCLLDFFFAFKFSSPCKFDLFQLIHTTDVVDDDLIFFLSFSNTQLKLVIHGFVSIGFLFSLQICAALDLLFFQREK